MMKRFLRIMIIGLLIVSSVLAFSGCKKNDNEANKKEEISKEVYEKPLRTYLDGIKNKSLEQVLQAFPEFMHAENLISQENIEEAYKQYEEELGQNITFEYEIGDPTEIEQKDADNLAGQLKALYPDAGEITIDKAYIVTVKMKIYSQEAANNEGGENSEGTEENKEDEKSKNESQDFYVYRYNENWYMW
ncbi:MAG: hypothetical protein IKE01_01920 [Clostridia bacterium]|nr:hypothetical protein [Clostridia bacterium]